MVSKRGMYRYTNKRPHKYVWALNETGSTVLDGAGNGSFQIVPGGARERWMVTLINTFVQELTIDVPTLRVYRGSPMPAYQLGGTFTGNLDTNSTDTFLLNMNEGMWFVYTGGPPGALATIRIEGTRYVWE